MLTNAVVWVSWRASPYLMALPAAVLLMAYALVNGVPFVYPDAFVYFAYGESAWQKVGQVFGGLQPSEGPPNIDSSTLANGASAALAGEPYAALSMRSGLSDDDWTPHSGRSVYYGVLSAVPFPFTPPWNGIGLQAYSSALTVAFAWRGAVGTIGFGYLAAMGALGLATTFGIFASTAMPDVWAAIGILAVAVLVTFRDQIGRIDGIVLWCFVLFAALAHSSHLAILATLTGIFIVARAAQFSRLPWQTIGSMVAITAMAVGLGAGARLAMERAAGNPPRGHPFFTAHLVDGGPGMEFIRTVCPDAGFAVCERADELPLEWRHFLGSIGSGDFGRRVAAEDKLFALATLRHDPAAVIGLALRDAVRQVTMIGLVSTPIRAAIGESNAVTNSPGPLSERVRDGRLYDEGWLYRAVSGVNTALVLAGIVALAVVATREGAPGGRDREDRRRLLTVSLGGILLNAAICGILASPYDRFQARVAWLIPVLAIIAIVAHARDRRRNFVVQEENTHDHHR